MSQVDIRDVAKAAGVSISTVSRAFSRPDMVSAKTREKVLTIASNMGFAISRSAGALKTGQSNRVALLINEDITSWFNAEVYAGLNDVLHEAGYDISLYEHIDSAQNRADFFSTMPVRRNVDAVVIASFGSDPDEAQQLKSINVPLVGINIPNPDRFDASICVDDEGGMYAATQHLIALGRKNLVYACSAPIESLSASVDDRGRGFERACKEAVDEGKDIAWQVLMVPRGSDFADAAMAKILTLKTFPDAICCQMDMMAIPLLLHLPNYGRHCPQDFSIIGFDDSIYADCVGLTTMRQDPRAMGRKAGKKVLQLIHGQTPQEPHEVVTPQLVLRDTDKPLRR